MGISFKLSKTGKKFRPKLVEAQDDSPSVAAAPLSQSIPDFPTQISAAARGGAGSRSEVDGTDGEKDARCIAMPSTCSKDLTFPEIEVSFTLYLFQKGYFIGKPNMIENLQPMLQDIKSLHPYDKASEALFSAIESGWLPGDVLDDIPSKYYNGTIVCEVHDYRKCILDQGGSGSLVDTAPTVNRVHLRMTLENVVKDIPLISDDSWTYRDLMEVESHIVKALQPELSLDPTPRLDKLYDETRSSKLNLGLGRKKRPRPSPEVTVTSTNPSLGKKVFIDVPENSNFKVADSGTIVGDAPSHVAVDKANAPQLFGATPSTRTDKFIQGAARTALPPFKFMPTMNNSSAANFAGMDANMASSPQKFNPYLEVSQQDVQMMPMPSMNRAQVGIEGFQHQQAGSQLPGLNGMDMQCRNPILHQQADARGAQISTPGGQRYPSPVVNSTANQEQSGSFYLNQGLRYGAREEQTNTALIAGSNPLDQQQFRPQQQPPRNNLPPLTQWPNPRVLPEKDLRKDDMMQKRKPTNSSHVSSGPMVQSPVSSKSGEISSGSVGGHLNAVATSALGSQKVAPNSNAALGTPSVTSSPSDSMQRQQIVPKRKPSSITKTQTIRGVGSPVSVSAPLNACSPSIGTAAPTGDQVMLDHFSKLEMIHLRIVLEAKKKILKQEDRPSRKPQTYSTQKLCQSLNQSLDAEDFIDLLKPLSKSVIGGTANTTFKTRVLNFMPAERVFQVVPTNANYRLTMSEKVLEGTVAMQYGNADESDLSKNQDCVQILPSTNYADLLAAQFCSLMERDGYQKIEDQTRATPLRGSGSNVAMVLSPDCSMSEAKNPEISPGQPSNLVSPDISNGARLMVGGSGGSNGQALPAMMSQNFLPRNPMPSKPQQLEAMTSKTQQQLDQSSLQQQQQQQLLIQQNQQSQIQQQQQVSLPQMQRSGPMLSTNPYSQLMGPNANLQMNPNQMLNKPSHMQLQMLQQQAQQQQQNPLSRKVMMGLNAAAGMGNLGGSMIGGLGGLGNVMSIGGGGVRGMSSPMGMPGLGGMNPNQLNLGVAAGRPGAAIAAMAKLRMNPQAARAAMSMYGGPQSGIANMPGSSSNQMLPGGSAGMPMLAQQGLNRGNMGGTLQHNPMASASAAMGPPKVPVGNIYFNQQQQQLQQMQQQQLMQQQQQQQISSPLQQAQAGSPQVVGSPPTTGLPPQQQQQISPQQIGGAQTVMSPQLSSGALQQMNNASPAPASPQLSSQTHGSVGRIAGSPMEPLP